MADDTTLPEDARAELRDELDALRGQRADMMDVGVDQAAEDSGDRAEALRRADDVARLDDRIAEITRLLAGGPGAAGEHPDAAVLPEGTEVTLRHDDGTEETLRVVGSTDVVPDEQVDSVLTLDSPLGRALVERTEAGDTGGGGTVDFDGPDGRRTVTVLALRTPG